MIQSTEAGRAIPATVWLITAGVFVALVMFLLFRAPSGLSELEVIRESDQGLYLRLPGSVPQQTGEFFVTATEDRRGKVYQRLGELQARYRQLAPSVSVIASSQDGPGRKVAQQIGAALSQNQLGQFLQQGVLPEHLQQMRGAIVMRSSPQDKEIAKAVLFALSPYLAGTVFLQLDADVPVHRMQLLLLGEPRFGADGLASYGQVQG